VAEPVALWSLPTAPVVEELTTAVEALGLARRYRDLDRDPHFPREEFRALGRGGWLGLTVDPGLGGRGLPLRDAAAALFHLGLRSGTTFAKLALQPEFCSVLRDHGTREQIDRWYRPLLQGERLVGNQVTEPGAGSDAAALSAEAVRDGAGYRLSGSKSEIAFAEEAEAAIVYARRPGSQRREGVSAFLVPQDLPGIRRRAEAVDLGERWQRRGRVEYHDVTLPPTALIGEEGAAFSYLQVELARERALLSAIYLGVARSSWEETVAHAGRRTAFGRALREHEAVAFALVDDAARLEAAWLLVEASLARLERGEEAGAETALAKSFACDVALEAIDHALQFHGGRGYSSELPHEQRWRDVRSGRIAHGPSEVMHLVATARLWPRTRA
jgi:butyryl-CoA dehydrogenase